MKWTELHKKTVYNTYKNLRLINKDMLSTGGVVIRGEGAELSQFSVMKDFISLNLQKEIKMATASNEFKLIGPSGTERYNDSAVTLSCRLSPEISAVNMEIRWFKETDCVCVYKNREVTEGRGLNRGRVSLFTQELERGNVSLQLKDCTESDGGYYLCQVTDGDKTEEITVMMGVSK
ncbi:hypothetical protein QTP70_033157 [Hemibagrus guttatus]|uniref:Ig-like domain-containing protein n=1 Tax=Hemibagrus guttatus TaxID=175788 RepID=A0AAE0PWM9_9TELE|nr:hypothetical protein QTP70_033157 [Hemibagrus guttatus]